MPDPADLAVSDAALLELKEDLEVFRQGHRFLDEKRMLVAQELLKRTAAWRDLQERFRVAHERAVRHLRDALRSRGFDGLQVARASDLELTTRAPSEGSYLGIPLLREAPVALTVNETPRDDLTDCRAVFHELLEIALELASSVANLHRLAADYRRTERRTRALEDILLPELDNARQDMESRLEEIERDEVTRVRWFGASALD